MQSTYCPFQANLPYANLLSCYLQVPPPLMGREAREEIAHAWNTTVDKTLGQLVVALSSRGW